MCLPDFQSVLSMKILAIDPSIRNVGVACYWTDTNELLTKIIRPPSFKRDQLLFLAKNILSQLEDWMYNLDILVVEYPNWQGTSKGAIAAQQGYTLDLAFMVGLFVAQFSKAKTFLPTPMQWKGNLKKEATQHRVQKQFGELNITEHEYDAVGMIQWYLQGMK